MSLYGFLLHLVHVLIRAYVWVHHLSESARNLVTSRSGVGVGWTWDRTAFERIRLDAKLIRRIPVHVAILLAETEVSLTDVANLVVWCAAIGISYVSVYDYDGILKKNREKLSSFVNERWRKIQKETPVPFVWNEKNNKKKNNNGTNGKINGCCHHAEFECFVDILSSRDGKLKTVRAARELAEAVGKKDMAVQNINFDLIDQKLTDDRNLCPDLVLCCGGCTCTIGFPPWHLHLSEILQLRTHHHVNYNQFLEVLMRFSHCEQRCGK